MSWFSDLTTKYADEFTNKFNEKFNEVTEHAKSALHVNPEMIEKLTLTTPELTAERKKLEEQEKRKEIIKDCLAGMLPWETRDPERDILVEECKELIMKLSEDPNSFKGPFLMPGMAVNLEDDEEEKGRNDAEDSDDEEEKAKKKLDAMKPSKESLEKLAKLEPLPKLLQHFDLDAHVGLIQKLLGEDPKLSKMQAKLSGGGEREHYFWKNYFVNCAFARYEAGLDIDEIWSEKLGGSKDHQNAEHTGLEGEEEEVITFDEADVSNDPNKMVLASSDMDEGLLSMDASGNQDHGSKNSGTDGVNAGDSDLGADYDDLGADAADVDADFFGGELDELEAEIARELHD